MTTKNLVVLASAAAVLAGGAYLATSGKRMKSPSIVGEKILAAFDASEVARLEIGGAKPVKLAATDAGWVIETLHNYPADVTKIREQILKLQELKVGQVANGRKIERPALVDLQTKAGKSIASIPLGETHQRKSAGGGFGGGGYPDGRYLVYKDQTVLVKETLDAFDGDPKKWCDTRIAEVPSADVQKVVYTKGKEKVELARKDSSWLVKGLGPKEEFDSSKGYGVDSALSYLNFNDVAPAADRGFATGAVYVATLKDGKCYKAEIGDAAGSDRWLRLSATFAPVGTNAADNAKCEQAVKDFNAKHAKWIYAVSSYSAEQMSKQRKDLVKAKEEPKKDDAKKDEKKSK